LLLLPLIRRVQQQQRWQLPALLLPLTGRGSLQTAWTALLLPLAAAAAACLVSCVHALQLQVLQHQEEQQPAAPPLQEIP
jgi:hypothetical protein